MVFRNVEIMAESIVKYYRDPAAVEKEFIQNKVNNTMDLAPQPIGDIARAVAAVGACEPECREERPALARNS